MTQHLFMNMPKLQYFRSTKGKIKTSQKVLIISELLDLVKYTFMYPRESSYYFTRLPTCDESICLHNTVLMLHMHI